MKVVIAVDSFKGSMGSMEAGNAAKSGMESCCDADIVVTGEGRMDFQTAMGKVPVGVARLAKKYGAKVLAFAGGVAKENMRLAVE